MAQLTQSEKSVLQMLVRKMAAEEPEPKKKETFRQGVESMKLRLLNNQ